MADRRAPRGKWSATSPVPQSVGASRLRGRFGGRTHGRPPASVPQPLPILSSHSASPACRRTYTAPIIDDSGSYAGGPIIRGRNTSTSSGYGVVGLTQGAGAGIYGASSATTVGATYGVYGVSAVSHGVFGHAGGTGAGVVGTSAQGYGIEGATANPSSYGGYFTNTAGGTAIDAASTSGTAFSGRPSATSASTETSTSGAALYGYSGSGDGLYAASGGGSNGVEAHSNSGTALYAQSGSGFGLEAITGGSKGNTPAVVAQNASGNGADVTGTYIGVVARAPTGAVTIRSWPRTPADIISFSSTETATLRIVGPTRRSSLRRIALKPSPTEQRRRRRPSRIPAPPARQRFGDGSVGRDVRADDRPAANVSGDAHAGRRHARPLRRR